MIDIGKQITTLRRARDMTQEQLATLIGVSAQTVSKWECGITMPDILLLPVIAEIFETSIDALFGIPTRNTSQIPLHAEITEQTYDKFLLSMWDYEHNTTEEQHRWLKETQTCLQEEQVQSMRLSPNGQGMFADRKLGVINCMDWDEQLSVLQSMEAAEFLSVISDPAVRQLIHYQMTNGEHAFTAATAAVRCSLSEETAVNALETLVKFHLTSKQVLELTDETTVIYHAFGNYKLLLLSAILSAAKRLADWKESYRGFCI